MEQPVLHVTNWSSRKLHGPARRFGIMARPRVWEEGDGRVPSCMPTKAELDAVRDRALSREAFRQALRERLERAELSPGHLVAHTPSGKQVVADGDTLCCACSRADAASGWCHRVWVSEALARAGWRVFLDGVEVRVE